MTVSVGRASAFTRLCRLAVLRGLTAGLAVTGLTGLTGLSVLAEVPDATAPGLVGRVGGGDEPLTLQALSAGRVNVRRADGVNRCGVGPPEVRPRVGRMGSFP